MNSIAQLPQPDDNTPRAAVAAEIRGHLAKRRIATYRLPEIIGGTEGRGYWQRRVSGEIPFDIDDLARIASMLGVKLHTLIPTELPDLDSNQEPIVSESAPETQGTNVHPIDFARARHTTKPHTKPGTVTPIKQAMSLEG